MNIRGLMRELYVNGGWVASSSGRRLPCVDPATEEAFETIACANAEDVDAAVKAAHKAFEETDWKKQDPEHVKVRTLLRDSFLLLFLLLFFLLFHRWGSKPNTTS